MMTGLREAVGSEGMDVRDERLLGHGVRIVKRSLVGGGVKRLRMVQSEPSDLVRVYIEPAVLRVDPTREALKRLGVVIGADA